jgi:hypothetical protein
LSLNWRITTKAGDGPAWSVPSCVGFNRWYCGPKIPSRSMGKTGDRIPSTRPGIPTSRRSFPYRGQTKIRTWNCAAAILSYSLMVNSYGLASSFLLLVQGRKPPCWLPWNWHSLRRWISWSLYLTGRVHTVCDVGVECCGCMANAGIVP